MALGVSMARRCPDQSATEAARSAYVREALKPANVPMLTSQPAKPVAKKNRFADDDFMKRLSGRN